MHISFMQSFGFLMALTTKESANGQLSFFKIPSLSGMSEGKPVIASA
jgi:hypothetical protein